MRERNIHVNKKKVTKKKKSVAKPVSTLDKLKKGVQEKIADAKKQKLSSPVVFTFERKKHFVKKLSASNGFGYQDLKPVSQEFYRWLINTYKERFSMTPATGNVADFSIKCQVKI